MGNHQHRCVEVKELDGLGGDGECGGYAAGNATVFTAAGALDVDPLLGCGRLLPHTAAHICTVCKVDVLTFLVVNNY